MNPLPAAILWCVVAAVLEGLAAGRGIRARFAELRLPSFSPPLMVWTAIGLCYYGICFFILWRLFSHGGQQLAIALTGVLMLANAAWGVLFFRRRNLRLSFLAFPPYAVLTAALGALLFAVDRVAALVLLPYLLYLIYATWWGYRLWRLNEPARVT